jgi:hypothetical protein
VTVMVGEITHAFIIKRLRLDFAETILLLEKNTLLNYGVASKILFCFPDTARKIIIHSVNLRFMRSVEDIRIAKMCSIFNLDHLAKSLVQNILKEIFHRTSVKDVVVLGGLGVSVRQFCRNYRCMHSLN